MPSDPHSFDELKLPFIFVPHGAPEPTEWLEYHRDWIMLPATFVPTGEGTRQPDWMAGVHAPAQLGSVGRPAASSGSGTPRPQAQSAVFDPAPAPSGRASPPDDPVVAYRMADDAMKTAAAGYACGLGTGLAAPTRAAHRSDPTSQNQTLTDAE